MTDEKAADLSFFFAALNDAIRDLTAKVLTEYDHQRFLVNKFVAQ